jgi:hypothetical protein
MNIEKNEIYTIKLNSGEELIAKVTDIDTENNQLVVSEPVSVAPSAQGMGLVPSVFTANNSAEYRINTTSVAIYVPTDDSIKDKYVEATSGIQLPEKKVVLG